MAADWILKSLCYEALPFVYDCKLCRIDADSCTQKFGAGYFSPRFSNG